MKILGENCLKPPCYSTFRSLIFLVSYTQSKLWLYLSSRLLLNQLSATSSPLTMVQLSKKIRLQWVQSRILFLQSILLGPQICKMRCLHYANRNFRHLLMIRKIACSSRQENSYCLLQIQGLYRLGRSKSNCKVKLLGVAVLRYNSRIFLVSTQLSLYIKLTKCFVLKTLCHETKQLRSFK